MRKRFLTKKEVLAMFREAYAGKIQRGDSVARNEEWNNFTDVLRTDKLISEKAYNTWVYP